MTTKYPTLLIQIDDPLPYLTIGEYTWQPDLSELSNFARTVGETELRETDKVKEQAIKELRELLRTENELAVPIDNDYWLIRFLRPCKFYPDSAFDAIQRYYKFRLNQPILYKDLLPSNEVKAIRHDLFNVMPNRDQLGRRVLICEVGKKWNPKIVPINEVLRVAILFLEMALVESNTQVHGVVVILDMQGFNLSHVMQITPAFAQRMIGFFNDGLPLRLKGIHIINQNYFFNMAHAVVKPFLSNKLRERIHFHGTDRKSLCRHISPEFLPLSCGGSFDIPRLDVEAALKYVGSFDREFTAISSYGYK